MKRLDTQSRGVAAAIAGILAGTLLAVGCGGSAEAETEHATEANGCNGANGCSGEATATANAAAESSDANGCNGANGCGAESVSAE